jgi:hypothetical protein
MQRRIIAFLRKIPGYLKVKIFFKLIPFQQFLDDLVPVKIS